MIFNKELPRNVSHPERNLSCAQLGIQLRFQEGRTCRDVGVAERLDVPLHRLSLHRCNSLMSILLGETDLPRRKDRGRCTRDLDVGDPTLQIEVAVTLEVVAVTLEVEARDREILQLVKVVIVLIEAEGREGSIAG